MRRISLLFFVMSIAFSMPLSAAPAERFAVYYGEALPASAFDSYDVIVFDSTHHPPVRPLKNRDKIILGYISLGEAEKYRPYFNWLKKQHLLLAENVHWKGHHVIDVRNPLWTSYVIEELIPDILQQGFDGIMIDTIDSAIQPELDNPKAHRGMIEASVRMIKAIRIHYPDMPVMLNRGFEILPQVAGDITMLMAESTYADYDFSKKTYKRLSAEEIAAYDSKISAAKALNSTLSIYSMDYWDTNDTVEVKAIYAAQRARGLIPYVSVLDLQTLHSEPQ